MNKFGLSIKLFRRIFLSLLAVICVMTSSISCYAQSETEPSKNKKSSINKREQQQYLDVINGLFYLIQQQYVDEVDPVVLYEGALKGMLDALGDPYSTYMDKADWRSITDTTQGSFGGVGLSISKPNINTPEKPAYVEVVTPIDDTPGAKAGIQPGDYIIAINGNDTAPMSMEDVLGMLRGTIGESVNVTIKRGKGLILEKTLVRALIENPTVKYGMIDNSGYIRISEFSATTADHVQEALDFFNSQKENGAVKDFKGIIIDLRNNGGGLLNTATEIADKFIDEGPIVSTKGRIDYENSVYYANRKNTKVKGVPVIVLINRGSASASEILSGALKDSKVAYLVGERSFGKGSVQIPRGLINNDGFKITVARYYTPSDVNIDKVGIPPDREVLYPEYTEEQEKAFSDLIESDEISKYVQDHEGMTEKDIASYAKILEKKYPLEERVLRKLIRNETDRTKPSRLYDLDYDIQLVEALNILNKEDFDSLMMSVKTVKEIQEESKLKE